jgi:hypothetical protein
MLASERERGEMMGYYKNLIVEDQERVDRISAWYRVFRSKLSKDEMNSLLSDESRLLQTIAAWEKSLEPKPAAEHVSLNVTRKEMRAREKAAQTIVITRGDYMVLFAAVISFGILSISLLLWLARLV